MNDGFEKIKETIMSEAKVKADQIRKEKAEETTTYLQEKTTDADEYTKGEESKIVFETKMYEDRTLAQARLNNKREYLKTRETLIEELVKDVTENLARDASYKNLLKSLIKENIRILKKPFKISCDTQDEKIVETIIKELKIKEATVHTEQLLGGVVIEDSTGKRINDSMSSLLERKRNDIRQGIVKLIEG